jgi:choline-sulfatase
VRFLRTCGGLLVCVWTAGASSSCRQPLTTSHEAAPLVRHVRPALATEEQHEPAQREAAGATPIRNVLLITVDAFRADQPWVGYAGVSTPNLNRLAESSVVYTHTYSLANTTGPSLGALLNGRFPSECLRDDCPLVSLQIQSGLAETLSAAGIQTMASHGHVIFAVSTKPARGFAEWRVVDHAIARLAEEGAITGKEVASNLISLLRENTHGRFFAWAHFLDPHDAYAPHPGFAKRKGGGKRAAYDVEVAYTDFQIGRVLAELSDLDLADSTAVIVTADHGEAFGEHGPSRHGFTVFDEEIRVPLMLHVPGQTPRRLDVTRSLIDMAPTIADLMGVPAPEQWRGTSLRPDWSDDTPVPREVLVDCPKRTKGAPRRAWISDNHKVIMQGGQHYAFDLAADPHELHPLSPEESAETTARADAAFTAVFSIKPNPCRRAGLQE